MANILPFMDINLHASDSHYAFLSPSNPTTPTLVVERPSGDLRLTDGKLTGSKRVSSISGILGMIRLRLDKYLVVITKSVPAGKLKGSTIYKIVSIDFFPLHERQLHDHDEDKYLNLLRSTLKSAPMYFSYNLDLTSSFQRQARSDASEPLWQRADDRFFWNRFLCSDFIEFRAGYGSSAGYKLPMGPQPGIDPYILPIISGTLSITKTSIKNNPLTFGLLTRKSRHRVGTRYFSRGMDEAGHVANFNETEQIMILNDSESGPVGSSGYANGTAAQNSGRDVQILSYVQTRGSVPVYWSEINTLKYTPKLEVRGIDSALNAAKAHFDEQINIYGDNYMINLVNQKGREKNVKDAYEQMVRALQTSPSTTGERKTDPSSPPAVGMIESSTQSQIFDRLHYVYFDFHNETKGLRWHRAQLLLDELNEALLAQRYFHGIYPSTSNKSSGIAFSASTNSTTPFDVRATQKSVVRTNCMDCLDRTNVIQSMLGRTALDRQLTDLQLLRRGESASDDPEFANLFRNVWADNADTVSRSYSGTGALKTDFTRTGTRTRKGALQDLSNSITRYVRNNFRDGPRQDGFDIFSGAFLPEKDAAAGQLVFVDRRPLGVQAVPYVLGACLFFLLVSTMTSRLPDATAWPLRILMVTSTIVAAYCGRFVLGHGTLYVAWPKLNPPSYAMESYTDAMNKATQDPIVGKLVQRERGMSDGRMVYMEEGKKRKE